MSSYFLYQMSALLCSTGALFIFVKWRTGYYMVVVGLVGLVARVVTGQSGLHLPGGWVWLAALPVPLLCLTVWLNRSAARDVPSLEGGPVV